MAKYINKGGFVRYWDAGAKAPYLWNPAGRMFISYADEESMRHKVAYVRANQLAGVMFWEYVHDLEHKTLLNTLVRELTN